MHIKAFAIPLLLTFLAGTALAAEGPEKDKKPDNEQVIVPQVDRRDVKPPRIPSNDFEIGLFYGTYATQNFGSSGVVGVRMGYHITEDYFVEAVYGRTKVSDESFRQVLPGGVFAQASENLTYYNLSAGINVLPGEVFIGKKNAKASALYLVAGVGNTSFNEQRCQTVNFGVGMRVFPADWAAVQVDMRDHIFSLDLLGKRQSTQNLELSMGVTFFF